MKEIIQYLLRILNLLEQLVLQTSKKFEDIKSVCLDLADKELASLCVLLQNEIASRSEDWVDNEFVMYMGEASRRWAQRYKALELDFQGQERALKKKEAELEKMTNKLSKALKLLGKASAEVRNVRDCNELIGGEGCTTRDAIEAIIQPYQGLVSDMTRNHPLVKLLNRVLSPTSPS